MASKEELSAMLAADNGQKDIPQLISNIATAMSSQGAKLTTLDKVSEQINETLAKLTKNIEEVKLSIAKGTPVGEEHEPSGGNPFDEGSAGAKKKKWSDRVPLSKLKFAEKLPKFAGKRDEFTTFKKKVVNFLGEEPGLREILKSTTKEFINKPITTQIMRQIQVQHDEEMING